MFVVTFVCVNLDAFNLVLYVYDDRYISLYGCFCWMGEHYHFELCYMFAYAVFSSSSVPKLCLSKNVCVPNNFYATIERSGIEWQNEWDKKVKRIITRRRNPLAKVTLAQMCVHVCVCVGVRGTTETNTIYTDKWLSLQQQCVNRNGKQK